MEKTAFDLVKRIVYHIEDKLGEDIIVLDLSKVSSICDYFVIASAASSRQVKAIADEVEDQLTKIGVNLSHKEGYHTARWILMDYGDVVVHLFHEEDRAFYNIERIWRDALTVNIDKIEKNDL
ncbi:ribosome silencing factor [Alkaliphilus crotonatoxidans]|jgi:ribosome-associated protein